MGVPVDLTALIRRAQTGDAEAANALFTATYPELRRLARARLRGGGRSTVVDTTSIVHEYYLRFAGGDGAALADRAHFMRYASRAMRAIIIDLARRRLAARRGGGAPHLTLSVGAAGTLAGEEELVRVHEALEELAALDERMAEVVALRYFGGLTEPEIAEALGVTDRTVRRDWEKARAWLAEALRS